MTNIAATTTNHEDGTTIFRHRLHDKERAEIECGEHNFKAWSTWFVMASTANLFLHTSELPTYIDSCDHLLLTLVLIPTPTDTQVVFESHYHNFHWNLTIKSLLTLCMFSNALCLAAFLFTPLPPLTTSRHTVSWHMYKYALPIPWYHILDYLPRAKTICNPSLWTLWAFLCVCCVSELWWCL